MTNQFAYLRSIGLALSIGIAILEPGQTEAQEAEDPAPRAILQADGYGQFHPRIRFSLDGKLLATWKRESSGGGLFGFGGGGGPSQLKLWDATTAEKRLDFPGAFVEFEFAPDGKTLAICSGGSVSIRDTGTGAQLVSLEHNGVHNVQYLRNGELLATLSGGADEHSRHFKLWDTTTWMVIPTILDSYGLYYSPVITPDGNTLAAFVKAGQGSIALAELKIWNLASGMEQVTPVGTRWHWWPPMLFAPDGQTLVIPSDDGTIVYWDVAAGKLQPTRDYMHFGLSDLHFGFSEWRSYHEEFQTSGSQLTVSVELAGNRLIVRDSRTDQILHDFVNPSRYKQSSPGRAEWWTPNLNQCHLLVANRILMLHFASKDSVERKDRKTVIRGVTSIESSALEIVDLTSEQKIATFTDVSFVATSYDGELIVTRDLVPNGFLTLWRTRGGIKSARIPYGGHSALFSRDSATLATAGSGVIELWNVADFLKVE